MGDNVKANLCMAGIIALFLLLTLIAYLLTEGKTYCIIPLMRYISPKSEWLQYYDNMMDGGCQKSYALKRSIAQHVLGVKRPCLHV